MNTEQRVSIRIVRATTRLYWEKYAPIVEEGRRSQGARWLSETEYLYVDLMKYLEKNPELNIRIEKYLT